jgi:hypothetical protein
MHGSLRAVARVLAATYFDALLRKRRYVQFSSGAADSDTAARLR